MLNRNLVYQTWIKNWGTRNIYVDYFCWWYDLHVCGAHSAHYLHAQCWRTTPNKVYHYLPGSDFYTSVTRDLCNVLLHFTPFEICSRWTKFSHPNHIAWNVMILSDDNVNWLFLYFFLRGERCNSDVNTVNGNNYIWRHTTSLDTIDYQNTHVKKATREQIVYTTHNKLKHANILIRSYFSSLNNKTSRCRQYNIKVVLEN